MMPGIAENGCTMRKSGPNKISSFIRSNESQIVVWHPGWLETFARVAVGAGHEGVGGGAVSSMLNAVSCTMSLRNHPYYR